MLHRRILALLLLVGLAPGTWLRSPPPPYVLTQAMTAQALPLPADCCAVGPLRVTGAWQLTSPNQRFGGYSALVHTAPGRLLAISDGGYTLDFPMPGRTGPVSIKDLFVSGQGRKADRDTEAAQWDPVGRHLWVAAEGRNLVMRFDPALALEAWARPAALRHWPANTGPETMAMLPDGRFAVVCECRSRWRDRGAYPALLFPRDPTSEAEPLHFFVAGPWDYRPTDAAVLPDGRLLVVQRKLVWPFPARFDARLALLDLDGVQSGAVVPLQDLGALPAGVPMDNYEGLALEPLGQGRMAAWLISDDNNATFQRTLLLRLEFRPDQLPAKQKARR